MCVHAFILSYLILSYLILSYVQRIVGLILGLEEEKEKLKTE